MLRLELGLGWCKSWETLHALCKYKCVFVKSDKKKFPDLNFIPEESKSLFQVSAHLEAPTAADTHQRLSNSRSSAPTSAIKTVLSP